eukprot:6429251-Amphidinium_carterae.1
MSFLQQKGLAVADRVSWRNSQNAHSTLFSPHRPPILWRVPFFVASVSVLLATVQCYPRWASSLVSLHSSTLLLAKSPPWISCSRRSWPKGTQKQLLPKAL